MSSASYVAGYASQSAATYQRFPSVLKTLDGDWCLTRVNGRWRVRVWCLRQGRTIYVGCYGDRETAVRARDAALRKARGSN